MRISSIFEAEGKSIAVGFGRMNPPTIGHAKVIDAINSVNADDHALFLSRTYEENPKSKNQKRFKNPLPYDYKLGLVQKAFGDKIKVMDEPSANTPVNMMKYLESQGYTKVFFVLGEERLEQGSDNMTNMIDRYNGVDYNLDIEYVGAGKRPKGATGAEGASGTKMREFVINDDLDGFKSDLPPALQGDAEEIFSMLRKSLEPFLNQETATESIELRHNLQPGKYKHSEENVTVEINKDGSVSFIQPQEWEIESDPEYLEWVEGLLAGNDWITTEVDEPEQTKNKRDLLNRSLRAQGHKVVPLKTRYNRKKERQMKFGEVYQEDRDKSAYVSPQANMLADVGRLLDDMIPDFKISKATKDEEIKLDDELHALANFMSSYAEKGSDVVDFINKAENKTVLSQYLQKALAAYDEGKRADISRKVPDPVKTDNEDDAKEGNEFADKVNQLRAQGAKPGTKFKTSDGKEHVLTDSDFDEGVKKMHPREKLRRNFEKIAGYSLDDREKEYQAILDRYKKEKEEEKTEGVFDKDGMLGKFVKTDTGTDVTTGKPNAPTFMGFNVSSRDKKIDGLKKLLKVAQQNSGKPGSGWKPGAPTIKDVPRLQAELAKLEKEKAMQGESVTEGSPYQDGVSVIQHLEAIVRDKQAKAVPFADGKGKVDMFTASAVTKIFDAINEDNKRKVLNMIGTRDGFMKIAKFALGKVNEELEESKKKGGKDGKACWDGYYLAGTKMKGGKEVDDCRPRKKPKKK